MTIVLTLIAFMLLTSYIFVWRLLNGNLTGTFKGFIGIYILKTFKKGGLYYRGTGLPVTLTKKQSADTQVGTVIFLKTPDTTEQSKCTYDFFDMNTFIENDYWWTTSINRNGKSNDFSRFDDNFDEILILPFWLTPPFKELIIILAILLLIIPSSLKASNYNDELITLHKNLSNFQYDFKTMPVGKYREQHARKHFFGYGKPLPTYTSDSPYGRRNSAAIVDIITIPSNWELCEATDEFPIGTINYKLGLWNEQWKLLMIFGYVSKPIRGQSGGVLVSAYVEKRGKAKLRCDWRNKNHTEFNLLRNTLKQKIPNQLTIRDYAEPVVVGAMVGGVYVMAGEILEFLTYILLAGA